MQRNLLVDLKFNAAKERAVAIARKYEPDERCTGVTYASDEIAQALKGGE